MLWFFKVYGKLELENSTFGAWGYCLYKCVMCIIFFVLHQEGNVANQREHLILLLANAHTRHFNKQASISEILYLFIYLIEDINYNWLNMSVLELPFLSHDNS